MTESYRDPYPSLRERLYWLYIRYLTNEDVPEKAWVKLSCPETGETIATENTEPLHIDRDVEGGTGIWSYECDACDDVHSWLWGPPAPILVTPSKPKLRGASTTCPVCRLDYSHKVHQEKCPNAPEANDA